MLTWESAGTDEPSDQNAVSRHGERAHWSLGPNADGRWGVELMMRDDEGDERPQDGVGLGLYASEADAKQAAQEREDEATHTEGDGCATYPDGWYEVTREDGEKVGVRDLEVGDVFTEGEYDACEVIGVGRDISGDWHLDLAPVDGES